MSEPKIRRKFKSVGITLSTSSAGCTVVRWDDVAGGTLIMGTVSTNATSAIQLWGSDSTAGPFGPVYSNAGQAAGITLAPSITNPTRYAIPDEAYGLGALMLVSGGTNATAAICRVTLKT